MTIKTRPHPVYSDLLVATLVFSNGLFSFLSGITREQVAFLEARKSDEAELLEIACSRHALLIPSLRSA